MINHCSPAQHLPQGTAISTAKGYPGEDKNNESKSNTEKVVKATVRMEKTLLEATCKMGKLREIQQTQAAEANPSAGAEPVLFE